VRVRPRPRERAFAWWELSPVPSTA